MTLAVQGDMLGRKLAVTTLVAGLSLPLTGCFDLFPTPTPTPTFQRDDVSLQTPTSGLRVLGEKGQVMEMADEVALDVNRWVAEMAVNFGEMLDELNAQPPRDVVDGWNIYGPHDAENGEDASWMARVSGDKDEVEFEVLVGERGASESEMVVLFTGNLAVDGESRSGGFTIDFDVISKLEALQEDVGADTVAGQVRVDFSRGEKQDKDVTIEFVGFSYTNGRDGEDLDYKDETYVYHRETDGSGLFHFASWAPFEDEGWSGPEYERVTVDMVWDADLAGRARAQILEVEGEGDLRFGDVHLNECFDAGYSLTWANLNEPYASDNSGYNEGDESACLLKESALDAYEK
ncbi:MAG: hypothetical protein JKY37_21840 [Nannocystaceae bacterium]|nr:hypothetical protein [Nannocystaceae bacterium]